MITISYRRQKPTWNISYSYSGFYEALSCIEFLYSFCCKPKHSEKNFSLEVVIDDLRYSTRNASYDDILTDLHALNILYDRTTSKLDPDLCESASNCSYSDSEKGSFAFPAFPDFPCDLESPCELGSPCLSPVLEPVETHDSSIESNDTDVDTFDISVSSQLLENESEHESEHESENSKGTPEDTEQEIKTLVDELLDEFKDEIIEKRHSFPVSKILQSLTNHPVLKNKDQNTVAKQVNAVFQQLLDSNESNSGNESDSFEKIDLPDQ